MDDFMKKVPTNKMVGGTEMHHKTSYQGKHHARAPYSSSEMRSAMDCSNGKQGLGLAPVEHAKMPEYGVYGKVISVTHGHHDVKGSKI